jgi:outer membrane protein
MKPAAILLFTLGASAWAQGPLSLKEAVRLALEKNKSIEAAGAAQKAAESRIGEARGGYLPKVNYQESWTRSDNPVFVFGSLLTQHQFIEDNFQIRPLNRPDFLNNFQSLVTADQTIYDFGHTKRTIRSAELGKDIAGENHRLAQTEVIARVVRAYYGAVLAQEELNAALQSVRSAQADLQRAESVRKAGMSTEADVLSIRVHLAGVEEQRIKRSADLDVARAALNEVLGLPLDTPHDLTTPLARIDVPETSLAQYESSAIADRSEARQAKLGMVLAENEAADARSSLYPQFYVRGAFEADRQQFFNKGGANWLVSAGMKWNLFNGFSDKARIEESKSMLRRSEAEAERIGSGIRLQVRQAHANLRAAEQRIEVAKASVAEAEESLRITQNRYEAGLANVTELLRTEAAVFDARTRYLAAIHDQRIAATLLEMAAGSLTADSGVLN